jgi:hypothetical protein
MPRPLQGQREMHLIEIKSGELASELGAELKALVAELEQLEV